MSAPRGGSVNLVLHDLPSNRMHVQCCDPVYKPHIPANNSATATKSLSFGLGHIKGVRVSILADHETHHVGHAMNACVSIYFTNSMQIPHPDNGHIHQ